MSMTTTMMNTYYYNSEDFHLWENKDILVNLHLLPFFYRVISRNHVAGEWDSDFSFHLHFLPFSTPEVNRLLFFPCLLNKYYFKFLINSCIITSWLISFHYLYPVLSGSILIGGEVILLVWRIADCYWNRTNWKNLYEFNWLLFTVESPWVSIQQW